MRRWDQTQGLYNSPGPISSGLIQVTPGTPVILENGIQVTLTIISGGRLHVGDAWAFAARVATGNVDPLTTAPPIAVRHHYASLGTFSGLGGTAPPAPTDCRVLWPPVGQENDCSCTICVDAAGHNAGTATIQLAINEAIKAGGGVVCLGPGTFNLTTALNVASANGLTIRGMGSVTILSSTVTSGILATGSISLKISDLTVTCSPPQAEGAIVAIGLTNCIFAAIERTSLIAQIPSGSTAGFGVGVGMTGILADINVHLNGIAADYGILVLDLGDQRQSLTAAGAKYDGHMAVTNLQIDENLIYAGLWGIAMGGQLAADAVSIARNVISAVAGGIGIDGTAVTPFQVVGNFLQVGVTGLEMACDDFMLADNVVEGLPAGTTGTHIGISVLSAPSGGQVRGAIERNRITGFVGGVAVSINADASRLTIRDNTIDEVDGEIILADTASIDDIVIEGNEITNVGAVSTTTSLENGFAGIAVTGATSVVIRGNTLMTIGAANNSGGVGVLGIGVSQPRTASVIENELRDIGSLSITTALTYGIRVFGPFEDVRIVGNRVRAALPISATGSMQSFRGVWVENSMRIFYPGAELDVSTPPPAPAAPVIRVVQTAVQPLLFQLNPSTSTHICCGVCGPGAEGAG